MLLRPDLLNCAVEKWPTQYGAALMQAYFGQASLSWISKQTKIPIKRLREWRQEPQFLLVMDWNKSIFSKQHFL
jgi:hypothetical protein